MVCAEPLAGGPGVEPATSAWQTGTVQLNHSSGTYTQNYLLPLRNTTHYTPPTPPNQTLSLHNSNSQHPIQPYHRFPSKTSPTPLLLPHHIRSLTGGGTHPPSLNTLNTASGAILKFPLMKQHDCETLGSLFLCVSSAAFLFDLLLAFLIAVLT